MFETLGSAKARQLMQTEVLSLPQHKTAAEAVALMDRANRGCVVVLNEKGKLTGIFTERDLLRRVVAKGLDPKKVPLFEVMTKKVLHVQANDDAVNLLELMCEQNFRHLPVLEEGRLVGIVSLKQFYKFFLETQRSLGV